MRPSNTNTALNPSFEFVNEHQMLKDAGLDIMIVDSLATNTSLRSDERRGMSPKDVTSVTMNNDLTSQGQDRYRSIEPKAPDNDTKTVIKYQDQLSKNRHFIEGIAADAGE